MQGWWAEIEESADPFAMTAAEREGLAAAEEVIPLPPPPPFLRIPHLWARELMLNSL